MEAIYLKTYLQPLNHLLARDDVTDIYINRPEEIWVETINGEIEKFIIPELSETNIQRLARQIAAFSNQGVNREHPLLAAILPNGERVQIVLPPATRSSCAIAIRKYITKSLKLSDYTQAGLFNETVFSDNSNQKRIDEILQDAKEKKDFERLLSTAIKNKKNILISGGTSTGKTTFLNALLQEVPETERLIIIEDTPEINLFHENAVGLIASRDGMGEARVTTNDLLTAALRMRPDRIIVGELRGPEAFTFLRSINTGHPGSLTTVHADNPQQAIEQIALLILQNGTQLTREDILAYVRQSIDVYVQLDRTHGKRFISEISLKQNDI